MGGHAEPDESYVYEPWYKYGIYFLFFEAAIAIGVTIYSLSMSFTGQTVQFKKKMVHDKPRAERLKEAQLAVEQKCQALEEHLRAACVADGMKEAAKALKKK
jgi:hypothetical protein